MNRGISGNTVVELRNRWQDDVISHKPDWLSIKIGINDVHHHLKRRTKGTEFLPPETFHEIYRSLLATTRSMLPDTKFLLISPFYLSDDHSSGSDRAEVVKLLPRYIEAVKAVSIEFNARDLPLHDIFKEHLRIRHADAFCSEPVHPNHTGQFIIAENIYLLLAKH